MEFAIQSFVNSWMEKHPLLIWLLQHPIISVISLSLVIILLFRLFAALAQLLDKFWLWLLKSPMILIKSLLGIQSKSSETNTVMNYSELAIASEKISRIIQQLETISQQQQQIIQELANLKQQQIKN